MARVILLERVICFPCLSEYRHQPSPALHIPCTAWNITFISMICRFCCCPRLFLHNTCRTSDDSAVQVRLVADIEHGRVYANVGGVHISDPNCNVTVSVMFGIAYFSVVFFYSQGLLEEETVVFEAHWMSFLCTELLLFNYAKLNKVFYSMAPLMASE